ARGAAAGGHPQKRPAAPIPARPATVAPAAADARRPAETGQLAWEKRDSDPGALDRAVSLFEAEARRGADPAQALLGAARARRLRIARTEQYPDPEASTMAADAQECDADAHRARAGAGIEAEARARGCAQPRGAGARRRGEGAGPGALPRTLDGRGEVRRRARGRASAGIARAGERAIRWSGGSGATDPRRTAEVTLVIPGPGRFPGARQPIHQREEEVARPLAIAG